MKTKILLTGFGLVLLLIALFVVLVFLQQRHMARFSKIRGTSTMSEVLNAAGMPDSITTNEAGGYVMWDYNDPWPSRSSMSVFFFNTNGVYYSYRVYHP